LFQRRLLHPPRSSLSLIDEGVDTAAIFCSLRLLPPSPVPFSLEVSDLQELDPPDSGESSSSSSSLDQCPGGALPIPCITRSLEIHRLCRPHTLHRERLAAPVRSSDGGVFTAGCGVPCGGTHEHMRYKRSGCRQCGARSDVTSRCTLNPCAVAGTTTSQGRSPHGRDRRWRDCDHVPRQAAAASLHGVQGQQCICLLIDFLLLRVRWCLMPTTCLPLGMACLRTWVLLGRNRRRYRN
jgi:hypothetical protein